MADRMIQTGPAGSVVTNSSQLPVPSRTGLQLATGNWQLATGNSRPGEDAPEPFVDRQKLFESLPRDLRASAVGGLGILRLIEHGMVTWEDVVTPERVGDLWEVVRRRQLTVEQLRKAGVPRFRAEAAVARATAADAAGLTEADVGAAHRRDQAVRLAGPARVFDQTVRALAAALAARAVSAVSPALGVAATATASARPWLARELQRVVAELRRPRRSKSDPEVWSRQTLPVTPATTPMDRAWFAFL
jgi:hypothetical protein